MKPTKSLLVILMLLVSSCISGFSQGTEPPGKAWVKLGFTTQETKQWIAAGFEDPKQAKQWKRAGFTARDAKRWMDVKISSVDDAREWKANGIGPEEADVWSDYFIHETFLAVPWRKKGFSPNEASGWASVCRTPKEALEWKGKGFTPEEVMAKRDSMEGIIREWEDFFEPKDIVTYQSKLKIPFYRALVLKRRFSRGPFKDPSGIEPFETLCLTNIYDLKGRFFYFYGKQFQVIDRTKALYEGGNSQVFYVDFGMHSAPTIAISAVSEVTGTYTYRTVLGGEMTVPKLRVWWFQDPITIDWKGDLR